MDTVKFETAPAGCLGGFVAAAVTERAGGVSRGPFGSLNLGRSTVDEAASVHENERRVLHALGLADTVARLRLEHGARVLRVQEPGMHGPADALLTSRDYLVLWLTVADCFPVVLTAGRWRVLGHCGWRGIAAGLAQAMVAELAGVSGIAPDGFRGWIGPGIGPCCYEVGPELIAALPDAVSPASWHPEGLPVRDPGGVSVQRKVDVSPVRHHADLRRAIVTRLREAGVPAAAVGGEPVCTSCHPQRFYSHRRDGSPSGRMAALSWVQAG